MDEFGTATAKILESINPENWTINGGTIDSATLDIFKARKRPVEIYAAIAPQDLKIKTLEGWFDTKKGDIIIVGVKGEVYSCKPDIFEMTYIILPDGEHTASELDKAMDEEEAKQQ